MLDFLEWFLTSAWPWIIAAIHLALLLGASAHVVLTKRDPRAAIGWIGIVWLAPIVGTLIYLVFGINRIRRKARALRKGVGQRDSSPGNRAVPDDVVHRILGEESQQLAPLSRICKPADPGAAGRWQPHHAPVRRTGDLRGNAHGDRLGPAICRPTHLYLR